MEETLRRVTIVFAICTFSLVILLLAEPILVYGPLFKGAKYLGIIPLDDLMIAPNFLNGG